MLITITNEDTTRHIQIKKIDYAGNGFFEYRITVPKGHEKAVFFHHIDGNIYSLIAGIMDQLSNGEF